MIFNFWSFCPYNPQMLWLKVDSIRHFVSCWILSLGLCERQATLPPTELHLRHYFWNKQKMCMLCEVTEAWIRVWHHPLNVRWVWSHLLNVWGLIWDLRIYSPCLKAPWKENVVWGGLLLVLSSAALFSRNRHLPLFWNLSVRSHPLSGQEGS